MTASPIAAASQSPPRPSSRRRAGARLGRGADLDDQADGAPRPSRAGSRPWASAEPCAKPPVMISAASRLASPSGARKCATMARPAAASGRPTSAVARGPWRRLEPDGRPRDDAERALRAAEEVLHVGTGAGLQDRGQVGQYRAVGEHRLEAQQTMAHDAIAEGADAAGIGGDHAADRRRAARRRVDARVEADGQRRLLQAREGDAGLDDRVRAVLSIGAIRSMRASERTTSPGRRDAAGDQAGAPALRHHADAARRAPGQKARHVGGIGRRGDEAGRKIVPVPAGIESATASPRRTASLPISAAMSRASASLIARPRPWRRTPSRGNRRQGRRPSSSMPWPMPGLTWNSTGHAEGAQALRREEQRLGRDHLILVAMDEQDRGPRRHRPGHRLGRACPRGPPGGPKSRRLPPAPRAGAARHAAPSWCPG